MYFPIGWPKYLRIPQEQQQSVQHVACHRDRFLLAVVTKDSVGIWFSKPCVQLLNHRRSEESVASLGWNRFAEWKSDSTALATVTSRDTIIFYVLDVDPSRYKSIYEQTDSKVPSLQRESAELFVKEPIVPLSMTEAFTVNVSGGISAVASIRDELVVCIGDGSIERLHWDGTMDYGYRLTLPTVPFTTDQLNSRATFVEEPGVCIIDIEYSPIVGGFAVVLSDGRAAFITAASFRFEPEEVQGIWAQDVSDATCTSVNHKYKLIAYGRKNAQVSVFCIDELTGELQMAHKLELSSRDFPDACNAAGCARVMKWTPDGCALAVAWEHGGLSVWSVFGALLMCSLGWDLGFGRDVFESCRVHTMEWGTEGYYLWMGTQKLNDQDDDSVSGDSSLMQMQFVKSALTVNPCMSNQEHVFLQAEDRLYINTRDAVINMFHQQQDPNVADGENDDVVFVENVDNCVNSSSTLIGNKQWIVISIPYTYSGTNWPVRYSAIDRLGRCIAIAGKTGVTHYDMTLRKWKLFGNETQEKDFVVTGGLLWWHGYLIMGCYNFLNDKDEIRLYSRESKLDNMFACVTSLPAQVLALNQFRDKLITFCANNRISLFNLIETDKHTNVGIEIVCMQDIDISALNIHPACVVSIALTSLRSETARHFNKDAESILINACGKLIMIQRDMSHNEDLIGNNMTKFCTPTVLASCVENVWVSSNSNREKQHLMDALWLACGSHGLKVWLPLLPRECEKTHNFMSRRIMLPFHVHIYPLAVLFEDAVLLGAENDTVLYCNDATNARSSLPFSIIERTSQVYLHHILRQLLRRNLGFHAWEIARSCATLPYFPHSLELLLHEVLEEEATSKEPIPDALLPRVIEFIREFPVYLQTVVQCARKTEIALWRYLFAAVGDPKDLFQECLNKKQLTTAASYLIILQNLEACSVSRQYATILLDAALDNGRWELAKDLVRFLRAIDPDDVESPPRSTVCIGSAPKYPMHHPTSPHISTEEDLSFVLGTIQVPRVRALSVTSAVRPSSSETSSVQQSTAKPIAIRKKSQTKDGTAEEFFIDVILQRHTRKLLGSCRLRDLGSFAAYLDIHLVAWLRKERNRAAKIDDFVSTLKKLHHDFRWPYPIASASVTQFLSRKGSGCSSVLSDSTILQPLDDRTLSLAMECPTKPQLLSSLIVDSGYRSVADPDLAGSMSTQDHFPNSQLILEAHLQPHVLGDEDDSRHTVDMSEDNSSVWGDEELPYLDERTWNGIQLNSHLEHLSRELATKGPQQSEVQLRYLLQLMMEAGCLDYSLLISVLLRDAMAVVRLVNACRAADYAQDVPLRLRDALIVIDQWTDRECCGYKLFMQAIRSQLTALNKIAVNKIRPSSAASSVKERTSVSDELPTTPTLNNSTAATSPVYAVDDGGKATESDNSSANSSLPDEEQNESKVEQQQQIIASVTPTSRSDCAIS